ncbi:MAG TPA: long-chain fatty acid--CoA ligase [Candidatus Thermoplasmatota archaeon]|nr:long-chain fatty acid--CoA ligase [Candidatus Thermoplasmatota archaeon]
MEQQAVSASRIEAMKGSPATLGALFWGSVQAYGGRPAQEWHNGAMWVGRTYQQFGAAVRDVAHALLAVGVKKGDRVAIWSKNSPQWGEVDFACQTAGFATVPIYDTLTGEKGAYILEDAQVRVLFVQDASILARLAPLRSGLRGLKHVVLLSGAPPAGTVSYQEFVQKGREWGKRNPDTLDAMLAALRPNDLASLVYTSGTTGEPKGVMLTQGNFATNAACMHLVDVGPEDVFLSFLPLSHVFERTGGHFGAYGLGAKVVFARSVDTLMDDMQAAHPTIMMSVPRLYEKMHTRVWESIHSQSWVKRRLFAWALHVGKQTLPYRERNEPLPPSLAKRHARATKLVLHKLHARVGGKLRYFVSGGAALSRDIELFFWAAGIQILQGYGLTETSPVCNVNLPQALRFGSVGRCIPGVECKIDASEWPQPTDLGGKPFTQGEICFRGPNVMQGYWRNEKATREVFDAEGFFHTGDIGYVDDQGYLFITDRKKEIIVMSNGKKVPPQPIENALQLQPHIAQAMILGENRNYISTLIVPDWQALDKFSLANGIAANDRDRVVADQRVVSLIEREVEAVNATLARYEQIKKFWILPAEWTVEGGELTPSLKLKRRIITERFQAFIDRLYPSE